MGLLRYAAVLAWLYLGSKIFSSPFHAGSAEDLGEAGPWGPDRVLALARRVHQHASLVAFWYGALSAVGLLYFLNRIRH